MQAYTGIRRFVQKTLGCSCPEEVFGKIDYQEECDDISGSKVNVGDRLLIYIITVDAGSSIEAVINPAMERGVEERDKRGFNRFRLVLVVSSPDELRGPAEQAFIDSGYKNEKTHLHVLNESDVKGI